MKLVTVAQMRELEQAAIAAGSSEAQLMEEAGLAVAQEAWMLLGTLEGKRIVVLAGPGNNGGDGLVAARHLADWGAEVLVYVPIARRDGAQTEEMAQHGVVIADGGEDPGWLRLGQVVGQCDLVVDALLGIGQRTGIDPESPIGAALMALGAARSGYSPPKLVACDLPTGIDADSGAADPLTVAPDMTVTFGLPKVGMYQAPAAALLGKVQVIDIGIPRAAQEAVKLELMTAKWARGVLPARPEDGNKGTFGKLLVIGGSRRYIGAPRLVAVGAYRAGAGLVTIACPEGIIPSLAPGIAEATWLPQDEVPDEGTLPGSAAIGLRNAIDGFEAVVFGPGMGNSDQTRALAWALLPDLGDSRRGFVLDADGLNALATFGDGPGRVSANAVLTPHPGELARLLGTTVADIQARRMAAAQEAATKYGCTVVLKGAHTVVVHADGRTRLSPFANPLLATAGAGDVLAGIIGAYMAQGLEPFDAASLGVYAHAAVGELLRGEMGEAGLLAGDIATHLPRTIRDIRSA